MSKQTQHAKAYVTKVNEKDFTLEVAVASDNSTDRQGEAIAPSAWRLENFKRNPVLLWAHDYGTPPIGKVTQIGVEGNQLLFKPQFAVNEYPFAKQMFDMFKAGFLNAFSVGFAPQKAAVMREDGVREWQDVELLEISAVPVPANANALVLARSAGFGEVVDKYFGEDAVTKTVIEEVGDRIHITVRDVKEFDQDSFEQEVLGDGIEFIKGKLASDRDGTNVIHKYVFETASWTQEDAEDWVADFMASKDPLEEPRTEPKRIISQEQKEALEGAQDALKLAADALTGVLTNSTVVKDNDGVVTEPLSPEPIGLVKQQALRIVRTEQKRATQAFEKANRAIKIVMGK